MRSIFPFILLVTLSTLKMWACECEHPGKPTLAKLEQHPVILMTKIDSISACEKRKGLVRLEGVELYKGIGITQLLILEYQCKGACAIDFVVGDIWLIFAENDSITGNLRVNLCSRTRKQFPRNIDDVHTIYNEATWEEEIRFLRNNFGNLSFVDEVVSNRIRNENLIVIDKNRDLPRVKGKNRLAIMFVSAAGFFIFFLIAKRFWKF